MVAVRQSPLHDALEHLRPQWTQVYDMPAAVHFGDPAREAEQAKTLALCDVSSFPRIGIKGRGSEVWLRSHGLDVPDTVYGHMDLIRGGGLIVRTGATEYFLEDGIGGEFVSQLWAEADSALTDVYRFRRQDAAMLLSGERAVEVFAETCGYNFREPDAELVFTRVAGVSCCILRRDRPDCPLFRIWCDGSFGLYLWEQLLEIAGEHGGGAVGLAAHEASGGRKAAR